MEGRNPYRSDTDRERGRGVIIIRPQREKNQGN